jgi:hypothetical protein
VLFIATALTSAAISLLMPVKGQAQRLSCSGDGVETYQINNPVLCVQQGVRALGGGA